MFGFLAFVGLLVGLVPVALIFVVIATVRGRARLVELERTVEELTARLRWLEAAETRERAIAKPDPKVEAAPKLRATPSVQAPFSDATAGVLSTDVAQAFRPADAELKTRATTPVQAPASDAAAAVPAIPAQVPPSDSAAAATTTPVAQASTPVPTESADSLETRIGSRWLLYVGVVAIIVGASYFEKLAIENRWIGETARVVQGSIVGLLLVYGGLRFVRAGYALYGQLITGCGVAVLYVSTYAAFNFYHLIGQPSAFVVMSAVTVLAAWLADRQRSQGLALMAVGGGFATPFLVSSGTDAQFSLFVYESILIAGTMFLAHRRQWPVLNVVSYGFTVLTVASWAGNFYRSSKYLPTELFLTLFCAMYLYILRECRRSQLPLARVAERILWTAPALYYLASLAILSGHSAALLVFLLCLSVVGVGFSVHSNSDRRLGFWLAAFVPLLLWCDSHAGRAWLIPGLASVCGAYLIHLLGHYEALRRRPGDFDLAAVVTLHLNGLGAYGAAYLLINAVYPGLTAPVAAGFAVWHGAIAVGLSGRQRDQALHFATLAFTLLTVAIAIQFSDVWMTVGWAAEGAAVIWLGLRERREWLRVGGLFLFAVAALRLIELQFAPPPVGQLVLFNQRTGGGLFMIALTYALAWIHRGEGDRRRTEAGIALVAAKMLVLSLAVSEILSYWQIHRPLEFEPASQIASVALIVGAVVVWLGLVRRQAWIRAIGGAVVAAGLFLLLSTQFDTAPSGYVALWNARAGAGVLSIAVLYTLSIVYRRLSSHAGEFSVNIAVLLTAASLFTLSFLTSEIDAFWVGRGASAAWSMARDGLQAIAWASIGSSLVWLGLDRRYGWMRGIGFGIVTVATIRVVVLAAENASPTYLVVGNPRFMASAFVVALLYGLAYLYRRQPADEALRPRTVLLFVANALTLVLLTAEITAFWQVRDGARLSRSPSSDSHFAREMMLSVTWALYATALIVAGFRKQYAPIRYFAIGVFVITIVKVFLIDLAELDQIYRVASIIGLGVALLATSYLYHRFRGRPPKQMAEQC
jgi:uncharacterized membrane protein